MGEKENNLVVVCKTYRNDFEGFCRLFESFKRYNIDEIPLYVSVPESDKKMFAELVGDGAVVVSDESYAKKYFTTEEYWGLSHGYINQEICKLSFWETGIAKNYLYVDSDAYFIKDFRRNDFMADENTPYSVLVMDKDLYTEHFYKEYGMWRKEQIQRIFNTIGLDDRRVRTCHGMTVLNSKVLEDFKVNFMQKNKLSYSGLIEISPFEYSWYNAWLQKSEVIEVVAVEPFFKTFHMRMEYILSRLRLISESDLSLQYVGIIMNSNWKPKAPPPRYRNPGIIWRTIYKILEKVG